MACTVRGCDSRSDYAVGIRRPCGCRPDGPDYVCERDLPEILKWAVCGVCGGKVLVVEPVRLRS